MRFQVFLFAWMLVSCQGWTIPSSSRNSFQTSPSRQKVALSEGPIRQELAGEEVLFAEARAKPGAKITWLLPGGKRRKLKKRTLDKDTKNTATIHGTGHAGKCEIAAMREEIQVPTKWKFRSEKEIDALAKMKILLRDEFEVLCQREVLLGGELVSVTEAFPDVYGDLRLLRFLRKQPEENPLAASLSYRRFLQWRQHNNIDAIRAIVEENPFQVPPELEVVADYLPCNFDTKDTPYEEGDSAAMISLYVGKWRTTQITNLIQREEEDFSLDDFLNYWTYKLESLHRTLYEESVKQKKMVFVDSISVLRGFSLQQVSPAFINKVLRPWIMHLQSHYPETAKRINIVNPPKVLSLLWKLVIPMIKPGTVAKIRIH